MKLKNVNKRIDRLVARIAKDTKKLAKLRRKLAAAPKAKAAKPKEKTARKETKTSPKAGTLRPIRKKRGRLTPEGRAKLRALMIARWAVKRAAAAESGSVPSSGG